MTSVQCRTFGHAWESFESTADRGTYFVKLRCTRCLTERLDEISVYGDLYRRRYEYQESYKAERQSIAEWRQDYLMEIKLLSKKKRAPIAAQTDDEIAKARERRKSRQAS